jgi:hypothetical protein
MGHLNAIQTRQVPNEADGPTLLLFLAPKSQLTEINSNSKTKQIIILLKGGMLL